MRELATGLRANDQCQRADPVHHDANKMCSLRIVRGAEQTREDEQRPGKQHQARVTPQRAQCMRRNTTAFG
jgi:hypothetical protein